MAGLARVCRVAKWVGLIACIAIGVVWLLSPWWWIECGTPETAAHVHAGQLTVQFLSGLSSDTAKFRGRTMLPDEPMIALCSVSRLGRRWWQVDRRDFGLVLPSMVVSSWPAGAQEFCVDGGPLRFVTSSCVTRYCVEVPLWLLFAAVGGPVGIVFWPARRSHRDGSCATCGYDLTKNESGRCPECGAVIQGETTLPATPGSVHG